jgi:hypothetical protein
MAEQAMELYEIMHPVPMTIIGMDPSYGRIQG